MTEDKTPVAASVATALEYATQIYGHKDYVTAVDLGYKYTAGERTEKIAIRVHVSKKLPSASIGSDELIPEEILGVPTDVIEATYEPHSSGDESGVRTQRFDVIQPGISIAHRDRTAGTLGAIVYDNATQRPCILSNWHVLAGDESAMVGDPILQPGPQDGGSEPNDVIAVLGQSMLGIDGDAAVAFLNGSRSFSAAQLETGITIQSARTPAIGEVLEKSGRSSGVTQGKVDGLGQYKIFYSGCEVFIRGFKLVPSIDGNPRNEELSASRDSGAVWYDPMSGEGVGLHFAGETNSDPLAEHALACYLTQVLCSLGVSLRQQPEIPVEGSGS